MQGITKVLALFYIQHLLHVSNIYGNVITLNQLFDPSARAKVRDVKTPIIFLLCQ